MAVKEERIGGLDEYNLLCTLSGILGGAREIQRCLTHEGDAMEIARRVEGDARRLINLISIDRKLVIPA